MTPKEIYSEKLRDPRWQKRRLETLNAADWSCESCGGRDRTLNVHHLKYCGTDPWETPAKFLECLCEPCHEKREVANKMLRQLLEETRTLGLNEWLKHVAKSSRLFDTAPDSLKERNAATFVIATQCAAMKYFWENAFLKNGEKQAAEGKIP